jgi:hypothetical protein
MRKALLAAALMLWLAPAARAAPATRIIYAGDWTGQTEIFAVDPSGKAHVAQITHWHGRCRMTVVAWEKTSRGLHYQPPDAEPRGRVSAAGVLAEGPIDQLAADGDRVAFVSSGCSTSSHRLTAATSQLDATTPFG